MAKKITLLFLFFLISFFIVAQERSKLVTKNEFEILKGFSKKQQLKTEDNRNKAYELAAKNNWQIFRIEKNGTVVSLQGVDDMGYPIYLKTFNNITASATTRTNSLYSGGILGLSINGSSTNLIGKLGLWDGGSVYAIHQEFSGGRIEQKDNPSTVSEHATHVAGTIAASGIYPIAKGMAWGLQKLYAYDFNSDLTEMATAASAGMVVSNHSYGYIAGWNYNSSVDPARWEWYGLPSATEDYKFGTYDNTTKDWDIICYNAPYFLPVKSSGNSRTENGPAVGEKYYGYNSGSTALVDKGLRPAGISNNDGYDIITTTATAKNILTVGAVYGLPFGSTNPSEITIAPFSSIGPTDDGRIKPDLVADGVYVTSTSNSDTKSYATLSGTSMSAPNTSGSLILLQEYYSQLNQGLLMRSATLKGLVIATTDEAGATTGPDYVFGWGLLNTENAASLIKQNGSTSLILEKNLAQGATFSQDLIASGFGPLKVTICWTDPEGTATPTGILNDRSPKLVNDLDLRITDGINTFYPYVLNVNAPSAAATTADNSIDNIEQIHIPNAIPGRTYTLKISHKNTLTKGPQNYSIIVSGIGGKTYCTSSANSSSDGRIDQFQLNEINNTSQNSCRSYSDFTNINTHLEAGKTYPFSVNIGTCGLNFDKIAKVFADWNSDGDFNDANETIATSNIINYTGIFSGTITAPSTIIAGNSSILRIVLAETANAANVNSCGNYNKGETQDYKINFIKSSTDVGVISINNIDNGLCASKNQSVSIKLKNFGSSTLTNIPITLILSANNTALKTINEIYTGSLAPNHETDFELDGLISIEAGKQYHIEAKSVLNNDLIITNNGVSKDFSIAAQEIPDSLSATICDNLIEKTYQLNGSLKGNLFWYPSAISKIPVAVGNKTISTIAPAANNTFYVGVNDYQTAFGPINKYVYNGGTYHDNFGPKPIITVTAPMVLDSARLYISKSGQLTFTVESTSGVVLSSTTINVEKTKTTTDIFNSSGQIIDDLNDPGKMYKLNLIFPEADTYRIGISYNGATIYRSNAGVTNIPIQSDGNIITLSGAYFDNGSVSTITNSYYYFYNMIFKSLGCTDYSRIPVTLNKPIITQIDTILSSSVDLLNQWYLNDDLIVGATTKTYQPLVSGKYRVDVYNASGCINSSDDFNYVLTNSSEATKINLKVYPIPSNGPLNVQFDVIKKENVKIKISNITGQLLYQYEAKNFLGKYDKTIDLGTLSAGIYLLTIQIGDQYYYQKISITHS
jgi:hypothetical protein